jgi:hypothetical protein
MTRKKTMKNHRIFLILTVFTLFLLVSTSMCRATPSSNFKESDGDWFDDWNINRNYYGGENGYLPNLADETLNDNKELAYSIGQSFQTQYSVKTDRAEAILRYVQQWTEYGYDEDNVFMDGVPQEEWAWNADETAHRFDQNTATVAIGDCEDLAFLCATIYKGAGFDAAVIDAPGHVALLIWLPEYDNADNYWNIPNDNRGAGWIWVESTGDNNPLGWTPPDYEDGQWTAYPLGTLEPIEGGEDGGSIGGSIGGSTDSGDFLSSDLILLIIVVVAIFLVVMMASGSKSRRR